MIGATYSMGHYALYQETKDKNLFEEIVDQMIIDQVPGMNDAFREKISLLDRDKKRMAILSLLDKDRNLFLKIKALINKDINKMYHIKDVVSMLREYVKVGEVERKKYGEVMTPLELVKEMLATLPKEVWSNPYLKWLDPANGTGPYPIMVIYKLMIGLKGWEPDDEKRYKHIVENMIYVSELQPKNMFLYMCVTDPFDTYKLNIYTGSFLKEDFDYHMKNVWGIEKFDIIIGNPPYQWKRENETRSHSLWDLFIEKSLSILENDGYLSMVHPGSWRNYSGKFENIKIKFLSRDILYLNINDYNKGNEVFGVSTDFDFYLIKNCFNNISTKIIDADNLEYNIKLSNVEFIPNKNIKILLDITSGDDKLPTIIDSSYHTQRDFISREKNEEFKYPIIYTVKSNGEPQIWYSKVNDRGHFGMPKIVFSNGAGSGIFIDESGEYGLSQFSYGIVENDLDKLKSIKNIMINDKFVNLLGYGSGSKYNKNILRIFNKDSWNKIKIILNNK